MSKGVPTKILLQPPPPPPPPPHSTSEPATVMVQWQTPYHLQVSSQIAQSVITASSLLFICCPSFNSGPSSKPTNSLTAHFNEKSPVHGPVHSPVHSPQSRFCSVPCKSWTLDSGLDHGLDYGLKYGLNSRLIFKLLAW